MTSEPSASMRDPEVQRCPYPFLAAVRAQAGAVYDARAGLWLLTRYDDVVGAFKDWPRFSSQLDLRRNAASTAAFALFAQEGWVAPDVIIQKDGAEHSRYRSLIDKVFSPARVKAKEPAIQAEIDRLIAALPDHGPIDFVQEFAVPLPLRFLAGQLGVRPQDTGKLKQWADANVKLLGQMLDGDEAVACVRQIIESQHYFVAAFADKRRNPGDDILSHLVALQIPVAEGAAETRPLTTEELLAITAQFLVAGHETTTNTLAIGMRRLCEHPQHQAALADDPEFALRFVHEVMRHEGVVQGRFRKLTEALEIGGQIVPEGAVAMLVQAGGNHDPAIFPDPERFDPYRPNARHHLTFGIGPHRCIGERLALAELRLAFQALARALTGLRLAAEPPPAVPHMFLHFLPKLEIDYRKRGTNA